MTLHPPAEIEAADLAGLALDLAEWGTSDLPFLTPPPEGALAEARSLLADLGALDGDGRITAHGRTLARMPLHPRLAHMLAVAGPAAAPLAALLSERDPMREAGADLTARLKELMRGANPAFARIREEARRLAPLAGKGAIKDTAAMAALAYPDRIGLRRPGNDPRWLLSGGKGAKMDPSDPLAGARLLVVTDTDGHPREAAIRMAVEIPEATLRDVLAERVVETKEIAWSPREGRVLARIEERLGQIALSSRRWEDAPEADIARAMLEGVRSLGLMLSAAAERFRARVALVDGLPAMDDATLLATLEDWLLPHLRGVRTGAAWRDFDKLPALRAMLDWDQTRRLDSAAPANFLTPLGRSIAIDYAGENPSISLRLQELFGLTQHPAVAGRPLRIELLSPAGRPVQVTMDLPGFWKSSYGDVRKDMRGKYPKHPWPEDPTVAAPTLRAKPRKG